MRQVAGDCSGKVGGLGFVLCGVEGTTHAVVYHGDGRLWVCGDGVLHGVIVIADGALEGVGSVENQADKAAHSVL